MALAPSLRFNPGGLPGGEGKGRQAKAPPSRGSIPPRGRASREDLTWIIDQIDSDRIVPIHTEAREWFADRFDNVVLAEEGVAIEL